MSELGSLINAIREERKREYISLAELLYFYNSQGKGYTLKEIAAYLILELRKFNPVADSLHLDSEENFAWEDKNGLPVYKVNMDNVTIEPSRVNSWLIFNAISSFFKGAMQTPSLSLDDLLTQPCYWLCFQRARIEEILGIKTLDANSSVSDTRPVATDNAELLAENERLNAEIAALKKELEETQAKLKQAQTETTSGYIYGHTSEGIDVIFKISKVISEKCDPDNPHSYPTRAQIGCYVKKYITDSEKFAEAVYQVVIPDRIRKRGNKPKGVDTFEGF